MEIVLWLFTIGYFFQLGASGILIYKIWKQRSINGLCWDTQVIFFLGCFSRCLWLNETRLRNLPLAHFELYCNTILLLICVYLCYKFRYTAIHSAPKYLKWYSVVACCIILSFFFHPGNKNKYYLSMQMLVSFTMFSESAGLLPQFAVMRKSKEIEAMTSKYIINLGIARLFRLIFWLQMYWSGDTFYSLIVADFIHTFILADFSLIYFKSLKSGKKLVLP